VLAVAAAGFRVVPGGEGRESAGGGFTGGLRAPCAAARALDDMRTTAA
jgi:hypothetical protein